MALRCPSARATDVRETRHAWLNMFKDVNLAGLCKTITADNGLEFSEISDLENETLSIYFARPYSPWERGSKLLNYRIPLDGFLKEVNKIIDLDILQFHIAI